MENLIKTRAPLRTSFTKAANRLEEALKANPVDLEEIDISFTLLSDKYQNLQAADNEILDLLSKDEKINQSAYDKEYENVTSYTDKYITLKIKTERIQNSMNISHIEAVNKKTVRLPKLELEKFDGSIKNWLKFWSIFKKIHEDPELTDEDKFVYLIQSTTEKSRARDLVESFPPTAENYPLVIDSLKSRFGKDELLIEVYVRELLNLVLNHNKSNIVKLYDKIESYLRSLGTLGVTSDKYAAMLYPLVESCLPEEILKIWERHISSLLVKDKEKREINKLSCLMDFLKSEVEGEERLAIAKNTFDGGRDSHKKSNKQYFKENKSEISTAAGLLNANLIHESKCIFCEKKHISQDCYKAKKMSIEEKRECAKRAGCCFLCIKKGHVSKNCRSKIKCFTCDKFHCTIMCPNSSLELKIETPKPVESNRSAQSKDQTLTSQSSSSGVLLQTLQVYVRSLNGRYIMRALIDTGSQRSYITSKAVKLLKYESLGEIPVVHSLFGGLESPQQKHHRFKVYLTSLDEQYNCNFEVLEQEKICGEIAKIPQGPWMKDLRRRGIKLTDCDNHISHAYESEIHLLIGADVAGKLLNGKIQYLAGGPVAVGTHLGWTLMGKIPQVPQVAESYLSIISLLHGDINLPDMWNLDRIGILDPVESQKMMEIHEAAYEHFQRNLKINSEGRYEITLPWIQSHPVLPEGRDIAERRLRITIKKLKTGDILEAYQDVLKEWLKDGIIEEVKDEDLEKPGHYLPHRAVVKNSVTTKIRPVFDASAHTKNHPSLNECLAKGPNLLELIPTILTRFRMKQFAVTSDIKQAFLQISVCECDRNYLKFLWMEDGDHKKLRVFRHCRVVFGLTSSPFLLSATLKHHLSNAPPFFRNTASVLQESFYVDNCLASFDSIEECDTFVEQSKELLLSGKFDLRGWQSNYSSLGTSQESNITSTEGEKQVEVVSVLGLMWDLQRDILFCNSTYLESADNFPITKRKILAIAQQVYDPLGIICAFTLLPKILLQECWKQKIPWDKELPEDIIKRFLNWKNQLNLLKNVYINRWMVASISPLKHYSLHVFADASKYAYAVCIFIRIEFEGSVSCTFVRAKNRITPLKTITIPRLELLACLIAARLAANVKKDMKSPDIETHYWTDSSNALSWIKRDEQWATFISNRVKEIRLLSNPDSWRHVPGNLNPADIPSRGSSVRHLLETKWLEGPEWLKSPVSEWPKSMYSADEEILNQERRKTVMIDTERETPWYCNRFSSYLKLVRVIAWMRRFITNAKKARSERYYSLLTVEEIKRAEMLLLKSIQHEVFVSINNPILKSLCPQLDEEGLIRVTTRLIQREDTDSFKRPIVLPNRHPVVHSLILEHHRLSSHAGIQTLMSQLRENFWILQCRRTIRQVLKNCINCRRFEASKAEVSPAPLPENRIRNAAAFEITGVDLGGPLYLRNGEKTWFVLFTCAVFRAIHLELVHSLTTESFCLAFRRFVSRRGRPQYVYSDNGTNLVGTSNILHNIDWRKVEEMASVKRIQWIFNPPTAAWWGGWWERLIGMTKRILRRVLGKARLNYDELTTILCEAENVINSRPLTYLSEDIEDLQPLTPSLFLQEIQTGSIPELDVYDSTQLNRRFRYRQKLKQDLMRRFRIEYLGQLKTYKHKLPTTLSVGQIVLVGCDNTKRIEWPMGKILELYPGKDNNTRVARLKTKNGEILRPYQRLYPLEVQNEQEFSQSERSIPDELESSPHLQNDPDIDYSKECADSTKPSDCPKIEKDCTDNPVYRTRCGRVMKPVKRLDL